MMSIMILLSSLASLYFFRKRMLRYLRYFQQEQYLSGSYLKWYFSHFAFDKRFTALVAFSFFSHNLLILFLGTLFLSYCEEDPTKVGKIKLNLTQRARRLWKMSFFLLVVFLLPFSVLSAYDFKWFFLALFMAVQLLPLLFVVANFLLAPEEKRQQNRFFRQAAKKYREVAPFTVGITGSFGKTSTKHILGEMMNVCVGPTFWPEKGVNALMGVTRLIREKLNPLYTHAVIEMGAYRMGSIAKMISLTPVNAGIITAVKPIHLDRFGSLENVYRAKSELARALPEGGILVLNGDQEGPRRMKDEDFAKKLRVFLYGLESEKGDLFVAAKNLLITEKGTTFELLIKETSYACFIPLWGKAAVSNALAVVAMLVALEVSKEKIIAALANLDPIDNRLRVQKIDEATTYIHDAYNSNPEGFETALEVLAAVPGKRKILMTPGMIELGEFQGKENTRLASFAKEKADLTIFVGEVNRKFFEDGFKVNKEAKGTIAFVKDRSAAFAYFYAHKEEGDVLLMENDLPDLYEKNLAWSF